MTTPDDSMELVEIVAKAIAADEDTPYRSHAALYRLSARAIITAIESSGRRIVPVEPTPAISRLSVGMSTTHEMARITFSPPLPR